MKSFCSLFCAVLFVLTVSQPANGQLRTEAGLSFAVGVPQGEFGDQVDNLGFGIDAFGAIGVKGLPIMAGIDLNVLVYGHERRREPFSTTIPDVTVKVATDNNMFSGNFFVRLQPDMQVFRPYADALVGFKHLFTQTEITNESFGEPIASSTNFDDTAFSYGFGGGMQFRVYNGDNNPEGSASVYIDLGAKYLIGSEAEYLKEGSIRRENGKVSYDISKSKTTVLMPYLGVSLSF